LPAAVDDKDEQGNKDAKLLIGEAGVSFLDLPRKIAACPDGTIAFLMVVSAPGNTERRSSLRRSWMAAREKRRMRDMGIFAAFLIGSVADKFDTTVSIAGII
jgi:hypothetical protein